MNAATRRHRRPSRNSDAPSGEPVASRPSWSSLEPAAKAFRIAHTAWGAVSMASLAYIWRCAATGRRNRKLAGSIGFLMVEGAALVAGRGDCPLGPLQARLGDPVPLFELVLPPRAARAAVPALLIVTLAGLAAVAARMPRLASASSRVRRSG
jgi:hypothetical protein